MEQSKLQYAIAGCGINVNVQEFPPELRETATSVALQKGEPASRESFLASILYEMDILYAKINELEWSDLCIEVERRSSSIKGARVSIQTPDGLVDGITAGLDSFGGLILETGSGLKTFYAGEVQECRTK